MTYPGVALAAEVRRTLQTLSREDSPFLQSDGGPEPSWRRIGLGLLVGGVVGIFALAATLILLSVVLGTAWYLHLALGGLSKAAIQSLLDDLMSGQRTPYLAEQVGLIWVTAAANMAFATCLVLVGSRVTRTRPRASLTSAPKWRWRHLLLGLALFGLFALALTAFEDPAGSPPYRTIFRTPASALTFSLLFIPAVLLAAAAEEFVFRGWILRHAGRKVSRVGLAILVAVLSSMIFSLIHWETAFDPNAIILRAAIGLGLCYVTLRMGGVEMATGAHAANNLVVFYLFQPFSLAETAVEPFDPWVIAGAALLFAGNVALAEAALRIPALARWVDPPGRG
ncbi:MAG: lysostaphin resistance A-like protein [Phenylobacterium sp.]